MNISVTGVNFDGNAYMGFLYEASEKCDGAAVKLKFVRESGQTMLSVENDFAKEPSVAGSQFLKSKTEDAKMHGIGIGNIRETVEEYGGFCVIDKA